MEAEAEAEAKAEEEVEGLRFIVELINCYMVSLTHW